MKINFACEINLENILRWFLGLVLIWAALGKLANLQEFFSMLIAYQLPLPLMLVRFIAVVLPWIELLCGLLLLASFRVNAALLWTLILFFIFAVCSGQAWLRGLHIACGCLDLRLVGIQPGSKMADLLESVGFALLRALVLTAAAVYLLRLQPKSKQVV
jgi:putative oxidoreductase